MLKHVKQSLFYIIILFIYISLEWYRQIFKKNKGNFLKWNLYTINKNYKIFRNIDRSILFSKISKFIILILYLISFFLTIYFPIVSISYKPLKYQKKNEDS